MKRYLILIIILVMSINLSGKTIHKYVQENSKLTKEEIAEIDKFIDKHNTEGLDKHLIYATMQVESQFTKTAKSKAGAYGLMQLMPRTAKGLGVNYKNVEENIKGGIMYLNLCTEAFKNDNEKALIAYNAGISRVKKGYTNTYGKKVISKYDDINKFVKTNKNPIKDNILIAKEYLKDTSDGIRANIITNNGLLNNSLMLKTKDNIKVNVKIKSL